MAEKMLTNWFTFLLYKFLKVGGPVNGEQGWNGAEAKCPRGTKARAQV